MNNYNYFLDGICYGDLDKIKMYLTKDNINLLSTDWQPRYPIQFSFETIDPKIVKYFLDLGADPNVKCFFGLEIFNSTIEYMVRQTKNTYSQGDDAIEHFKIIKLLYEYGADLNIKSEKGETPLDISENFSCEDIKYFLISLGAKTSKELEETK